jgi:putative ABC transport system substrate-binding protein
VKRREVITVLGGAAAAWPLVGRAQQMPVVAFVNGSTADASAGNAAAFRKGLSEAGVTEGRDAAIEYHWMQGQYDRVPGRRKSPAAQGSERG